MCMMEGNRNKRKYCLDYCRVDVSYIQKQYIHMEHIKEKYKRIYNAQKAEEIIFVIFIGRLFTEKQAAYG